MASKTIARPVRRLVRERADKRCEYCRYSADYACSSFICKPILPRVRGSGNSPSELAYACAACKNHKYDKTHARDPQTKRIVRLCNPRRQKWSRHFQWNDNALLSLIPKFARRDGGGKSPRQSGFEKAGQAFAIEAFGVAGGAGMTDAFDNP